MYPPFPVATICLGAGIVILGLLRTKGTPRWWEYHLLLFAEGLLFVTVATRVVLAVLRIEGVLP